MRLAGKVVADATAVSELRTSASCERSVSSDAEIFDIVAAAAVRCFFSKTLDALGVQPDAEFAELQPELRDALVTGRPIATGCERLGRAARTRRCSAELVEDGLRLARVSAAASPARAASDHQRRASSFSVAALMLAPGSQPFAPSQRSRCSSDRRKTIVLQVKPMSSHQRRAGTTKWTSSSAPADERAVAHLELEPARRSPGRRPRSGRRACSAAGDAERVPGAVREPRAPAGLDAVGRLDGRERVQHPDLGPVRLEHERVRVVQPPVAPSETSSAASSSAAAASRNARRACRSGQRRRRGGCEYAGRARPSGEYPPPRSDDESWPTHDPAARSGRPLRDLRLRRRPLEPVGAGASRPSQARSSAMRSATPTARSTRTSRRRNADRSGSACAESAGAR